MDPSHDDAADVGSMGPDEGIASAVAAALPRPCRPLYLVVDGMPVAGDTVEGVFAAGANDTTLELAVDVGRALIPCRVERSAAGARRAALQWLSRCAWFDLTPPEDAPLLVDDIERSLLRLVAQLDIATQTMTAARGGAAKCAAERRVDADRGTRWTLGLAAGHARRRAYHERELRAAGFGCAPWIDAAT